MYEMQMMVRPVIAGAGSASILSDMPAEFGNECGDNLFDACSGKQNMADEPGFMETAVMGQQFRLIKTAADQGRHL